MGKVARLTDMIALDAVLPSSQALGMLDVGKEEEEEKGSGIIEVRPQAEMRESRRQSGGRSVINNTYHQSSIISLQNPQQAHIYIP